MRNVTFAVVLAAICPATLTAQDDPMEVPRCVWSCLAAFGPADNPAYLQCTIDNCGFEAEGGSGAADNAATGAGRGRTAPSTTWSAGRLDGGATTYAGVDSADGTSGLY